MEYTRLGNQELLPTRFHSLLGCRAFASAQGKQRAATWSHLGSTPFGAGGREGWLRVEWSMLMFEPVELPVPH